MRALPTSAIAVLVTLAVAPAAHGHSLHTVAPGQGLWSISAQHNLTTRTVAVYNGLREDAPVAIGSVLKIPTVAEGRAALVRAGIIRDAAAAPASAAVAGPVAGAPRPLGAYVVRRGDTLTGLAAQTGVTVAQMAYVNGLSPTAFLLTGTVIKLPTGARAPVRASEPAPATRVVPAASPVPTRVRLSAARVRALAVEHGAPPALTAAIAWQESGFNNAVVSSANARGIMQMLPGTWHWVQSTLARGPLDPRSAEDNVRAGALYLARLLRDTGGDVRLAAAAYYQGLTSIRSRGLFADTRRYVDNVMALSRRFGG